jgi:hypothetical protein
MPDSAAVCNPFASASSEISAAVLFFFAIEIQRAAEQKTQIGKLKVAEKREEKEKGRDGGGV